LIFVGCHAEAVCVNPTVSKLETTGATIAGFKSVEQYGGMYINPAAPSGNNGGGGNNVGSSGDSQRGNPVVNGGGSVSWIHGRHTMKAGVDCCSSPRH
jgi:hypothetical protein